MSGARQGLRVVGQGEPRTPQVDVIAREATPTVERRIKIGKRLELQRASRDSFAGRPCQQAFGIGADHLAVPAWAKPRTLQVNERRKPEPSGDGVTKAIRSPSKRLRRLRRHE